MSKYYTFSNRCASAAADRRCGPRGPPLINAKSVPALALHRVFGICSKQIYCLESKTLVMNSKKDTDQKASARTPKRTAKVDHSKIGLSTGYLVRKTFRAFTRSLEQRLAPHDVSLSMWFFLRLLWEHDGLTQKELGDELGLTQATTAAAMDVMEKRRLIERRRNSVDRRKINIFLTNSGRELKTVLLPYAAEVNKAALAKVTAAELSQLLELLRRINGSLDEDYRPAEK
jgi:DNA-binding MarR family transcriptional regulator